MKLQSSKQKRKTIIIVAFIVAIVFVIAAVATVIVIKKINETPMGDILNPDANEQGETGILISNYPKMSYLLGEQFDISGANIQVMTTGEARTYFVDFGDSRVTYSGYDSSKLGEQVITVTYKEFTTTFTVIVKELPGSESSSTNPDVVNVEAFMFTTYTKDEWNTYGPSDLDAYIVLTYADGTVFGSVEETPIKRGDMYVHDEYMEPGITYVTITYELNGDTYEVTVPITITN